MQSTSTKTSIVSRLRVVVRGAVQGVGFRPFIYRLATEMQLPGWVLNSSEGVFLEVEGAMPVLHHFLRRIESESPPMARIVSLEHWLLDPAGFATFEIRESRSGAKTALILPDIATCRDCLREINDPADRRYRYPFTNCTNCGPRFTIIESLPYDRPRTAMKKFRMCGFCEQEYRDPGDRRFHAQPNACPECGPQLELWTSSGAALAVRGDALLEAAAAIRDGNIVAIKGMGGFHLMVDARNDAAILELRTRKRRDEKPFALMYPSLAAVQGDCDCSEVEERLLRSPEAPIVLVRRSASCRLPEAIAPGNPTLGIMLPYTPLHHLLMSELGFPVVATSGNLSEEPICIDEHEALDRLKGIADVFLVHDRPILRHVDDSIVREIAGRELVLRRARGFAPLPVTIAQDTPLLMAVGAHQKNAVAAAVGGLAFISQHIGDLESTQSLAAFERVNRDLRQLYDIQPVALACDLHPNYVSTQFAARSGERTISVQHHYAHALACMAENQLRPPVLAVTWDGSGYGLDETVWGGEFLRIAGEGCERVAHLRTFRLPGGEKAVKEPRRVALAILYETFGEEAFELDSPVIRAFAPAELRILRAMLRNGVHSPVTSSAGRLFDAVAALAGLRQQCRFEGQAAMELEHACDNGKGEYGFELRPQDGVVDWAPMIREIVLRRENAGAVSRNFHNTLANVIVAVADFAGETRVVLTGGCFQNRYLTERSIQRLRETGFHPYWHQRVPPNDGGIALGQIVAASARIKE